MKVSIDAATAKDQEIDQFRAELQEAKKREEDLHESLEADNDYWSTLSTSQTQRKDAAIREAAALQERLSKVQGSDKDALKKLGDLKERLRELGKDA